jgi:predicted membrane channel-forming protein YqfA (hemolysin III family)
LDTVYRAVAWQRVDQIRYSIFVAFEVPTAVIMKSSIFWNVMPHITVKIKRCFRATYHLHLQGQKEAKQEAGIKQ